MTMDIALRATEFLLGFAILLQSIENSKVLRARLYALSGAVSVLLMLGITPLLSALALVGLGIAHLVRFDGPYNGGSDRMTLLILICLCLAHLAPTPYLQELAFGYLAVQLTLSYVLSGAVKIVNVEWRDGSALRDVFLFSAYPVSETTREWAERPQLLWAMGWTVIIVELVFPLFLLTMPTLIVGLSMAALFHLANFYLFGLNRFFWAWIAAYPSLLWFQHRFIEGPV